MDLSTTYHLDNPYKLYEELNHLEVTKFMDAIDDQLYLLINEPDFHISRVDVMGKYYVIYFVLEKYKESSFALLWSDTVPRSDMWAYIRLRYTCQDPEPYFLANMEAVALDWIRHQEIE